MGSQVCFLLFQFQSHMAGPVQHGLLNSDCLHCTETLCFSHMRMVCLTVLHTVQPEGAITKRRLAGVCAFVCWVMYIHGDFVKLM